MAKKKRPNARPQAGTALWRELNGLGGVAIKCNSAPYIVTDFRMSLDFSRMPVATIAQLREEILRGWFDAEESETALVARAVVKQLSFHYPFSWMGSTEGRFYIPETNRLAMLGELKALRDMATVTFTAKIVTDNQGTCVRVQRSRPRRAKDEDGDGGMEDEDGNAIRPPREHPRGWKAIAALLPHHLDNPRDLALRQNVLSYISPLRVFPLEVERKRP